MDRLGNRRSACFAIAVVLAALRVGERAGRLSDWQALVLGVTQGLTRAAADLVVGPPDPRPVARRLALPRGASRLQQDLRRRAPPRHARRRRRLLLERRRPVRRARGSARSRRRAVEDSRRAPRLGRLLRDDPCGDRRRARRGDDRVAPRPAVADRDLPRGLRRACSGSPTGCRSGATSTASASARRSAIGVTQILALMPGVSRSGITITTGRFSGLDRDAAARFSFLLLIPIVFGAVLYKGVKHVAARVAAGGLDRPVHRRHARRRGRRPDRDRPAARLRAPPRLHAVRDLPARPRGRDRDRDRQRRSLRDVLVHRRSGRPNRHQATHGRPSEGRAHVAGLAAPRFEIHAIRTRRSGEGR